MDLSCLIQNKWNGMESYHGHLNAELNAPHPNIYIFVEVLLRQQAATYVTVSSLSKSRTIPRSIREKSARLLDLFTVYSAGLQTRLDYFNAPAINSHRRRSLPCIWWDSRCYCLLFLACRVFALSCQYISAIVVILFALSWVISVQQFTKFLRFRYLSARLELWRMSWVACKCSGQICELFHKAGRFR